ncbi:MAG: Manganese transport system membrane protein MntB [Fimbriimonadaceae bacterium]|nr:Manganese transport system membrane protein MntB [Fimbriimonadaceae bacterium]
MTYNTWLVVVGAGLLGALCGMVGSFAVLRRRSLLGDALAHATLPGIALAFWLTQTKNLVVLLLGALATGLIGVGAMAWMRRHTKTKEDAALGLTLSVMFGAGIALSRMVQNAVPGGAKAGLDSFILGKTAGIVFADAILVGVVSLAALLVLIFGYRAFKLVTFDSHFAHTLGWNTAWIDFALMGLIAIAVVVGLPMVGIVMVAALTILPAASARFWTEQLSLVVALSAVFGSASAVIGALSSAGMTAMPTGPWIILTGGALFLASGLFAPNRGVIAAYIRRVRFRSAILEDVRRHAAARDLAKSKPVGETKSPALNMQPSESGT